MFSNRIVKVGAASVAAGVGVILAITSVMAHAAPVVTLHANSSHVVTSVMTAVQLRQDALDQAAFLAAEKIKAADAAEALQDAAEAAAEAQQDAAEVAPQPCATDQPEDSSDTAGTNDTDEGAAGTSCDNSGDDQSDGDNNNTTSDNNNTDDQSVGDNNGGETGDH